MYGVNFKSCSKEEKNTIASWNFQKGPLIRQVLSKEMKERDSMVAQLRNDKEVMEAFRYDLAIHEKAVHIFHQQRKAMEAIHERQQLSFSS